MARRAVVEPRRTALSLAIQALQLGCDESLGWHPSRPTGRQQQGTAAASGQRREQTAVAGEGSGCSCIAYSESSRRRRSHFQDWWAAAVERGLGCLLPTAS